MDVGRFAEGQGLREVVEKTRFRFPKQAEQPDLMPDPDALDTEQAVRTLLSEKAPELTGSRRQMSNQLVILQRAFAGRPEILFIHALAISYLRRDTPHTQKARRIFFKLWDEQGEWLAANLNGRWLISALQSFADHGRSAAEQQCGSVGFLYGNLVKIYECEIASAYDRRQSVGSFKSGPVRGLFEFQPGDDILFNINTFVMSTAINAGVSGMALASLLAIVKDGRSIFSRVDDRVEVKSGAYFSFKGKAV